MRCCQVGNTGLIPDTILLTKLTAGLRSEMVSGVMVSGVAVRVSDECCGDCIEGFVSYLPEGQEVICVHKAALVDVEHLVHSKELALAIRLGGGISTAPVCAGGDVRETKRSVFVVVGSSKRVSFRITRITIQD